MKTIFVTGSAGFIGFHTSQRLLEEGYGVIGIDDLNPYYDPTIKRDRNAILRNYENFSFFQGDINNLDLLNTIQDEHHIDKICHLAAQAGVRYSLTHPLLYEQANIRGFINILEFARQQQIKDVVYASSSSVYGNTTMPKTGFSEKSSVNEPISVYGMTKRANELAAYAYHHLYGLNMTGLRFFTAYGPWGRPDMAYYKFVKAILNNEEIEVYNNGEMKRDFTYIDDIVDGILKALQQPYPYEIFNLGNSQTVKLLTFIETLEAALGKRAKKKYLQAYPGDLIETFADISHAKEKLGFIPSTDIETGLKKFVDWYKSYYHLS